MDRQVVWSARASRDIIAIYSFWLQRTGSNRYPIKLRKAFKKATEMLKRSPQVGILTDTADYRFVVIGYYKLFYAVTEDAIVVLSVFDSRQDPAKTPY